VALASGIVTIWPERDNFEALAEAIFDVENKANIEKMLNNLINLSYDAPGSGYSINLTHQLSINNRQSVQDRKIGRRIVKTIGVFVVDRITIPSRGRREEIIKPI
jgi:hypothetical protein